MDQSRIWLVGGCSLALGIILFCVMAGSYTSLWRTQNRINTIRGYLLDDCDAQVAAARDLIKEISGSTALKEAHREQIDILANRVSQAQNTLAEIRKSEAIMTREQVLGLDQVMAGLKTDILALTRDRADGLDKRLANRLKEIQGDLLGMVRKYNDEADYFNERKTVFPGFLVAKWFSLDEIQYPQFEISLLSTGQ